MLIHSLELAEYTIYTRQWKETIHPPMEISETKGGWVGPLPSLLRLLWTSVCLFSPKLCISGPLCLAPPTLAEIIKPGEESWDRFQLVRFCES